MVSNVGLNVAASAHDTHQSDHGIYCIDYHLYEIYWNFDESNRFWS